MTARTSESRQSAEALLSGAGGEAARLAMQMLVDLAKAVGAQGFLEIPRPTSTESLTRARRTSTLLNSS